MITAALCSTTSCRSDASLNPSLQHPWQRRASASDITSSPPTAPPCALRGTQRLWLLVALLLTTACSETPLGFKAVHIKVAHDGFAVMDAHPVDLDHDGGMDLVVATENDLRYLRHERLRWIDESAGTGLPGIAPAESLLREGNDFVLQRDGQLTRLVYSGIGSWEEQGGGASEPRGAPVPGIVSSMDKPPTLFADLNGDGINDKAWIAQRSVHLALGDDTGTFHDVSHVTGTDALALTAASTRLHAVDLEGDGDLDLLLVAGRLFALLNNGGSVPTSTVAQALTPVSHVAAPAAPASTTSRPWFSDGTAESGLDFVHKEGGDQWDIRPTMGPGAAFADIDNDGDSDLFVVGGAEQDSRLFINDGDGHFSDATAAWGLAGLRRAGMGALFADFDNDGDPDLYMTSQGPNVFWRHDGERFTNITKDSGTGDARWGASAACADTDLDGDLDLFVTNYLEFDLSAIPPESNDPAQRREDPIAMLPYIFAGQGNALYRNDEQLRFANITEDAGLLNPHGKSLGAAFFDHDHDGWPDLYVANDTTPNTFYSNLGDGTFEELSLFVGLDDPRGGMGLALSDIDSDGDEDIALTNWQLEPNGLYRNNHLHGETARKFMPAFEDIAVPTQLAQASVGYVGWGCVLADFDGDGDDDVFVANGYTSPDYETTMTCVGQVNQLFENTSGPGPFVNHRDTPRWKLLDVATAGLPFSDALASRSTATADVDGDGDLDLVVTSNNGPLRLLRNNAQQRSLLVVPEGRPPQSNRDAIGAAVTVQLSDGRTQRAVVHSNSGYLGQNERGLRFNLGEANVLSLNVDWPDGSHSTHFAEEPGVLRIEQPKH
ncbi:MAG: hypothetical protein ACI9EF_000118 [Pseudohongiellaceae bacterium]|jgi:hypothetical protein